MFSEGTYKDSHGTVYSIYTINEKDYYRIDICNQGAPFQLDPSNVLYSIIRKRKAICYGTHPNLYKEIQDFIGLTSRIKAKQTSTTKIEEGHIWQYVTRTDEAQSFYMQEIFMDGRSFSVEVSYDGRSYYSKNSTTTIVLKIDPLNIREYKPLNINVSTEQSEIVTGTKLFRTAKQLRAMYDIGHIDDHDFRVVTTIEEANKALLEFKRSRGFKVSIGGKDVYVKAFDTETTGKDVWLYGKDKLVGIVLSHDPEVSYYFPFRHVGDFNLPMWYLKNVMDVIMAEKELVAHNTRFDRQVMMKEGYDLFIRYDSLQLAILVDFRMQHNLKYLIDMLVGKKYLELTEIFYKKEDINFSLIDDLDLIKLYACPDTPNTLLVFKDLLERLPIETHPLFDLVESKLANNIADQEYYGIRIDYPVFIEKMKNCVYVVDVLEKAFRALTKIDGNIRSSIVISDLLYNKMRCPVLSRTENGSPSISGPVIKKLAARRSDKNVDVSVSDIVDLNGDVVISANELKSSMYPALVVLAKHREYNKRLTAYYNRFERICVNSRISFWVNQNGAESGRQSSPLHQLPPELKEIILSDGEDWLLYDADWSCCEIREQAGLANEKEVIELAEDPMTDVHRIYLSKIKNKPIWQITDEERKLGKKVNFGVIYEIKGQGLAVQIHGPGATKANIQEADNAIVDYFTAFRRTKQFQLNNERIIKQTGKISTTLHRYRRFPEVFDISLPKARINRIIRQGNNTPVQGSCADYMKIAILNCNKWIQDKGWNVLIDGIPKVRVMLSIHDEILVSAHKSVPQEEIYEMYKECMEMKPDNCPTFFVSPCLCKTFADHDADERAIPVPLRDELIEKYHQDGDKPFMTEDNYVKTIADWHKNRLRKYMEDLYNKYGPDLHEVGEHVRDPELTFALLGVYKGALKKLNLDQEEKINKATEMFFEGYEFESVDVKESDKHDDVEIKQNYMESLESLVDFDADGNTIYPYREEGEEIEEEEEIVDDLDIDTDIRVWTIFDAIFFDMSKLLKEQIDKVLAEIWKRREKDGFLRCIAIINDKSYDTKCRMEQCDIELFENMIKEFERSASNVCQ